ncbi:MAG: hypothetical protein FWE91_07575 [Defluviitaleaceae bacterium]|nr:hypothetical protein [Defluviitaleaceae bacterium]MCL2836421.1 hypothetical protein [Defluviitaleaceae bacterium]
MKKLLSFLILFILLCGTGCVSPIPEQAEPPEPEIPEFLLQEHYLPFPTREAGMILAFEEVGLDWDIWHYMYELLQQILSQPPKLDPDSVYIYTEDRIEFATCSMSLYANTFRHGHVFRANTHLDMSFFFRGQYVPPEEHVYYYNRFLSYEWPLFWPLAGLILDSADEISYLALECMEYFSNFDFTEPRLASHGHPEALIWQGTAGGVHCYVSFEWNGWFDQYTLYEMLFSK